LAGGDVPLGAVRAELLAAGAVQELGDGTLQVLKRHFIPSDIGEELFVGLIHIVEPVLSGLAHNVLEQKSPPFIQRVAYSERLPSTAREVFRAFSNEAATDFVHDMDAWISANELPPEADVTDGHMAGIGVFFYEKRKPRDS